MRSQLSTSLLYETQCECLLYKAETQSTFQQIVFFSGRFYLHNVSCPKPSHNDYRGSETNITESSFHASRRNLTSLFLDNLVFQFLVCSDVSVSVLTALLGVDIDLLGVGAVTAVSDQFADGRGGVLNSSTLQVGCL